MSDGSGHGEKRTRHLEQAVAALLEMPTFGEAAERLGVSESTLRRWAQQPEFAELYREARLQMLEGTLARLQAATGGAVETLVRLLDDGSPNAACRAAGLILDHAVRAAELLDLSVRLKALESRLPLRPDAAGRPPKDLQGRLERLERLHTAVSACAVCADVAR